MNESLIKLCRVLGLAALACGAWALSGCAQQGRAVPALSGQATRPALWLLGEVHDNPQGHEARLALLTAWVTQGHRPVLVMEQFDRERATALEQALDHCADAACVVGEAGGPGWDWAHYEPVLALALKHGLKVVAGNLSRADASRAMKEGVPAVVAPEVLQGFGWPQSVQVGLKEAQSREIVEGHCGMLPDTLVPRFVQAQIARDIWMAHTLLAQSGRDAVLLAGNGHIRPDWGVPYWLRQRGVKPDRVVAYVEAGPVGEATRTSPGGDEGEVQVVPAHARPDPCEGFKAPAPASR